MANIDKKIGIFPETGTSGYPRIEFTGSGNIPITIETLDDNSLNFKSSLNSSILRIYPSGTVSGPSGNFTQSLQLNGTGVSVSGHTHTSSNITDFNSSVSGLLPVTSIIAGSNITVSNNNRIFTISSSGNAINRGSFLLTSSSGTFNVSGGYTVGSLDVFLNGVKLFSGGDYTANNGTSFTLTETATSGSVVEYIASATSSAGSSNSTQSYSRSWFLS
jgi:hypothetical protein